MREQLCNLLARYAGQTISHELAVEIVRALFPDQTNEPSNFSPQAYKGLTFQVERFADIETEMHVLHRAHWQETEAHRHAITMLPDYEAFKEDERVGKLIQLTARDGDQLVGNIRMYLYTSRHTQTLAAKEDTFYLLPSHRSGFAAIRFWQYMEGCLKSMGVQEITTDSKVVNQVGRLNEYLGYSHIANVFHKYLQPPASAQDQPEAQECFPFSRKQHEPPPRKT
jgi:hypothetical protein